jgi:hypothetical protein
MNTNDELARVLLDLGTAGIELASYPTHPERLRHRPADIPPDLSERLRTHRAALLRLLVVGHTPADGTDAGYVYGERLGIADGLGMPTHPGSAAWAVAVGASLEASCEVATDRIRYGHGETDERDSGGDQGERPNALRDRQRCQGRTQPNIAAAER